MMRMMMRRNTCGVEYEPNLRERLLGKILRDEEGTESKVNESCDVTIYLKL